VQGIIFNAQVTQNNFLGSGNRVSFAFNNSSINRLYAIGFTNPYTTVHGISQGFDLSYRETNAFNANLTRFNSKVGTFGVNFGIPITEFQSFNLGLDYERTEISTNTLSADQVKRFIGDDCFTNTTGRNGLVDCSNTFNIFRLSTTFAFDSRNRAILPNQGMLHRVRGEISIPGITDYTFYKIDYDGHLYIPLIDDYTLAFRVAVGYGDAYGSTKQLPFFENFYGGGPQTVRGYRANTLGPRDNLDRPLGGSFKTIGNAELILPIPFLQDIKSLRVSAFVDAGNIYNGVDRFRLSNLRLSSGLSGIWVSPFGMISVSYAIPFNKQPGDLTQSFQFTFGTSF
jgi:outer membrane protein insertion porin family